MRPVDDKAQLRVLAEAARTLRPGGLLAILDSPVYRTAASSPQRTPVPTGVTAAAVTHVNGFPDDCSAIRAKPVLPPADVRPPSGGLSGTLTLINVNSGLDLGMNAIALAELSSQPFFRPPSDTYAGFSAQEIRPVSTVRAGGREYDLRWKNGVDAVSSVFMASELINEFVLEPGTASQTDWVITFPTRPYLQPGASPFQPNISFDQRDIFDREGNGVHHSMTGLCLPGFPCPLAVLDHAASAAFPVGHQAGPSSLLGSVIGVDLGLIPDSFTAGWMRLRVADRLPGFGQLGSEPGSTMTDLATGAVTVGRFELFGLPMTGFMVRTFRNGTLRCITNSGLQTGCQGNYAGSFPHRYVRTITQVP